MSNLTTSDIELLKKYDLKRFHIELTNLIKNSKIHEKENLTEIQSASIIIARYWPETTIKFLSIQDVFLVREILINRYILHKKSYPKDPSELFYPDNKKVLNYDWQTIFRKELYFITHKTTLSRMSSEDYVFYLCKDDCCKVCNVELRGKVTKAYKAVNLPLDICESDVCSCLVMRFHPEHQYIDAFGIMRLKIENEKDWYEWYQRKIVGKE